MDDQLRDYSDKLASETDSWDLKVALKARESIIAIDARLLDDSAKSTLQARLAFCIER